MQVISCLVPAVVPMAAGHPFEAHRAKDQAEKVLLSGIMWEGNVYGGV